jgi:CBS domain-containing protein
MAILKEFMKDVQVISPDATLQEAAKKMRAGNFGMLPVGENDKMIGSISDRDIAIRAVAEGKPCTTKIRDVMTPGIVWAYEESSLAEGVRLMSEHQVRRLPVVNSAKRLVGIVAIGDLAVESSEFEVMGETLSEISEPA